MNLLEVITQVRSFLEQNGRVSYRMLRRQFDLDEETLDELREELVDVQGVAADEGGRILVWVGPAAAASAPASPPAPAPSTSDYTPKAYTPKHLADRILTSRSALEGELKQVTVLFADVKGSMELAGQLDATIHLPHVHRTRARLLRRADGAVDRSVVEACLAQALSLARSMQARVHEPLIHLERAELAGELGDTALRARELAAARDLLAEMGATERAQSVAQELAT